ncbi:hypothetical protein [Shinella zoogloeoides]|uniref:hypothetical protein n=1 Tax=Shinella zoogloeoides TaxID=352475 RepID=UPI001F5970FE|nr:hypothetical protein [Shinella zoogloeoides]
MTARLIILNVCWLAALLAATILGYTAFVFNGDGSYVSYVIAAILACSVIAAGWRTEHILPAAWLCETLGFVGTLIGITIGLAGVDVSALQSTEGVIAAGNALFGGMSTAFCSTITGAIAMLWLWSVSKVVGAGKGAPPNVTSVVTVKAAE